jgi:methylglutaconyl-CoA hydratase
MQFTRLLYETVNRKATITLNRPEKRNALDDVMVAELTAAFTQAARDQNVKVILLQANGAAFCAGADLDYLSRIAAYDLEENRADSTKLASLFRTIYELRKPVIAVVNGPALAGGCGLASVCDFVIASEERAAFGYTEVHIGFIPAIVMIFLIKRVGEGRARELILRGNTINALDARRIGLANVVVPESQLEATVTALADELIQNNSLHAMGLCKEMLSKLNGLNVADALEFAANMNAAARMTSDCKAGIAAFLNKEKIHW